MAATVYVLFYQISYSSRSTFVLNVNCKITFFPQSHLDGCSQALQKCPNDCLAYIQRKFMEQHLLDCPKQINGNAIGVTCDDDDGYFVLEQIITSLQSALHEEIRQRHRLIADVSSLRKTFATETENQTIAVNSLKTKINDVSQQCKVCCTAHL